MITQRPTGKLHLAKEERMRALPRTLCLHQLFEATADQRPGAPAIISGQTTFSYGEVERRANQFARYLQRSGVKTGDLVGLYLERSPDAVVAILSILKAGAAYVPLDPGHPIERIRHILDDAGIATVVSEIEKRATTERFGGNVIAIDDPERPFGAEATARLFPDETGILPTQLSYVLYTSGSTGRPKGVMTEHRNVVSFVLAFNQIVRLTGEDRVLQGFSLGFDGSVEETWMAFSNGAALVVPERSSQFGNDLARLIRQGRVSVFSTVPTCLSMISDPLPTVRLLIVSGERCSEETVNRWATPKRRMLNVYGPTETTVNATAAECRPGRRVTIGRPLPGYEIHLLDEEQRPVARGEKGEIFITGPGVARGYLNQPELTERQFTALAVGTGGEIVRAYRSGDLASRSADGELLFHGRIDDQVKIRGFRVELSEIESVLAEHPLIRAAVVTVVERDGTSDLAAHVMAKDPGRGIDRDALRKFAATRLPSYMVPAYLDVLDVLPALPSGKVDRKCLPVPTTRMVPSRSIRRPASDLEAHLHRVFCRIFQSESISTDDDFFGVLGGYSLLAARLVSEIRRESPFEIAIRDVYDHPTIEALAAHLAGKAPKSRRTDRGSAIRERVSSRRAFHQLPRATRTACVALQAFSLYVIYGFLALPYGASLMSLRQWRTGAASLSSFVEQSLLITAGTWPALLALSIVVKWLVIGRYRPGAYPVWGFYYFRFWLARRFEVLAFPSLLVGTPLLPLYYRLMGAKVGRNCTIDTIHCAIFDLLTIGSDTSIGSETQLLGYRVEDGLLLIGSIAIGSRCFVGIHSALGLDVRMADEARLDDLSLLPDGATMLRGESWRGSPARPGKVTVPEVPVGAVLPRRRMLFGWLHLLGIYAIILALMPAGLPSAAILWFADASASTAWQIVAIPAAGVTAMAAFCLWVALLRRLILPRARVGVFPVESFFYLRKWAMFTLMEWSRAVARPLYTTIYLPAWLRLLGARIGRRAEISTVSQISPELTELGDQSFFADGSIISGRRVYRGLFELGVSRVGRRSFVGNSAILPLGKSLGEGCLVGCLSVPPEETDQAPDGTEWLGSPSFALPHRRKIECFDESVTHEPTRKLVAQRLFVDALRIVIPSTIVTAQLSLFARVFEYLGDRLSPGKCLLAMPLLAVAVAAAGLLAVVATKKILIGKFRPIVKPLWSMFVWLNEVVNGTYETVAAPLLVPLLGTPYCAPWLRFLGCKIGRHVYLETTLFSEFDLVDIGHYAALNAGAVIQNHLFEDRIMKASTLRVGDECSVGNMAVVLYDTEMGAGSSIGPLSLLMKGETLPPHTRWLGIPTAEVPLNKNPSAFSLPDFEHGANVIAGCS